MNKEFSLSKQLIHLISLLAFTGKDNDDECVFLLPEFILFSCKAANELTLCSCQGY